MTNTAFVVILGIGTVFAGLAIIILLCKLMSIFVAATESKQENTPAVNTATLAVNRAPTVIQNKQEILAAISAVVAEELGTDISNIRIHSIKRV